MTNDIRLGAIDETSRKDDLGPVPSFRGSTCVYAAADETAFCDLLLARFPAMRFIDNDTGDATRQPDIEMRLHRRLDECPGRSVTLIVPPDDWRPMYRPGTSSRWYLTNRPFPSGRYLRSRPQPGGPFHYPDHVEYSPPHLDYSDISVACWPGDKEQLRTAGQLVRLFASPKIVTRKVDVVSYPDYRLLSRVERHAYLRFGFHALAWAAEHPERMLEFRQAGSGWPARGIRPYGEPRDLWVPPAANGKE